MMSAGTAPSPSVTRHTHSWSRLKMRNNAMTASVSTWPMANMNCQRLPMTSRLPLAIDSMM